MSRNENTNQNKIKIGSLKKDSLKNILKKYPDKISNIIKSKIKGYTQKSDPFQYYSCRFCLNQFKKN